MGDYVSKWHRELGVFCRIKPLIVVEGNVLDVYRFPVEGSAPKGSILRLPEYLNYYFRDLGYETIVFYDTLQGFTNSCDGGQVRSFAELTGATAVDDAIPCDFKSRERSAPALIRKAVGQHERSVAIVLNLASRYITSPDAIDQSEVDAFTRLLLASTEARDVNTAEGLVKNLIVLVVDKVNDLPAWFYLDNPNVKTISINTPSKEEREQLVKGNNFRTFFARDLYEEDISYYESHPAELAKVQERFIALTEGFSFTELNGLRRLCKNERLRIREMHSVIDLYRYGIRENPWDKLDMAGLRTAREDFRRRFKGQDFAITKTLDIVKRAVTGLSGLQGSSHTRPKGVLFFAGPTGTGKTETAKTLAERLFGDESRCLRFDMSEYSQSHSDQKLLGAPPGYVGYETGGQLTNAIRENPFSILLFDEIEKAHPSVFDKFLQILEDGRMTDGQGNTAYFSECIIIFTSNLGIYTRNELGSRDVNVTPAMDYEEVQTRVRRAIDDYFKIELGRPEILNRIGENIVVFDFIRPDVAKEILDAQIERIATSLSTEKGIELRLSETSGKVLLDQALGNLENGGRGIGNIVESLLINPLSRYLFDEEITGKAIVVVEDIDATSMPYSLRCTTTR